MQKKKNDFIQQFVISASPWRHFGEYPLNVNSAGLCQLRHVDTLFSFRRAQLTQNDMRVSN